MAVSKPTPVVIDCDPGNDDAWAIISLLKGESRFGIQLKAVTVVSGNTNVDHGSLNALLTLKALDRLDVPVHVGASSGLINNNYRPTFHGADGFQMAYSEKPSRDLLNKKHAVEALKNLIEEVTQPPNLNQQLTSLVLKNFTSSMKTKSSSSLLAP